MRDWIPKRWWVAAWALWSFGVLSSRAALQFDMFPGYDQQVRSAGWYPVGFELWNDGPSFDAVIELSPQQLGAQPLLIPVELPTNTRKRLVVPMFCSSSGFLALDARLKDAKGKVRAENLGVRLSPTGWESFVMGAIPESFSGMPVFPKPGNQDRSEYRPVVTRMMTEFFPDNPIALEGLNALYLSSRRALELKEPQVEALLAWVHFGGHLIVSVDQPADVTATAWLRDVLPARVSGVVQEQMNGELQAWLKGVQGPGIREHQYGHLPPKLELAQRRAGRVDDPYEKVAPDLRFDIAAVPLVELTLKTGSGVRSWVDFSGTPSSENVETLPLIVSGLRGRGLVTVLAFHPEREPVRSWANREWLWSRIAGVPIELLREEAPSIWGGRSLDGLFAAMIETRQVRKLPVEILLLLLVVYLLVIGPIDQWWLRKINKPMLTWLTFPAYVALFSLMIWYIGFRLRAGNSEWNEFHVVDVQTRSADAVLRGRTFTSLYSPVNDSYAVSSELLHATYRPEFAGLSTAAETARMTVQLQGRGFESQVYVPLWSSQFGVADWLDYGDIPLKASFLDGVLHVENPSRFPVERVTVVFNARYLELGTLAAGERKTVAVPLTGGEALGEILHYWGATFKSVTSRRREFFGDSSKGQIEENDWPMASIAASLLGSSGNISGSSREFVWPSGIDLSPLSERKDVLVFGWLPDRSLVPKLHQFEVSRHKQSTLVRLTLPSPVPAN